MKEFIEKQFKREKRMRYFLFCFLPVVILWFPLSIALESMHLMFGWFHIFMTWWVVFSIYVTKVTAFVRSVKMLEEKGMLDMVYDIDLSHPIFPNAKIYCGEKAFFCKKSRVIMPYSEIGWVYKYKQTLYGFTVSQSIVIHTRNGKQFTLYMKPEDFKWMLDNLIVKNSPDVVIGYGAEQKARYRQLNPQVGERVKKTKRTFGVILMMLSLLFIILTIINFENAKLVPVIVITLISGISGILLFLAGKKK